VVVEVVSWANAAPARATVNASAYSFIKELSPG
jgi:hypothetical protein